MNDPLFTRDTDRVVRVALPVPANELFDYAVPEPLAEAALPGCRVRVRFRGRIETGVIVETGEPGGFRGRLHPLDAVLDTEPVLSDTLMRILREEATEILCPVGMAIAAALPPGSSPRSTAGWEQTPRGRAALEAGAVRGDAATRLGELADGPRSTARLRRKAAPALLTDLERDGLIAPVRLDRAPAARAATTRCASVAAGVDASQEASDRLSRAPQQAALLLELERRGETPVSALRDAFPTAAALLRPLAARGLVSVRDVPTPRDVLGTPLHEEPEVQLTAEQADALKPIADAVAAREARTFLLHGVTGSGKTEVYLRAVGEALRTGRQALVLVPEITLTHQILARLRSRFGDGMAVLHSGLSAGERLEQWQRLRSREVSIAVGARSALFAPLENLGVIVIDEEHDTAYKNDQGFRYHARDLARRRAAAMDCPVVLGSATPALETRFAADRGDMERLSLPSRIEGRPLPAVEIVDLQRERELSPRGRKVILSRTLTRALEETLEDRGQAILFLNRRGFSTQILCFDCGYAERCPDCDIALVFHATEHELRCHYCDHRKPPPETCGGCGAPDHALLGLGTERLEEELHTRFPEARIARLDRDTAARRGTTERILSDLRARKLDVVVGTQMVAKGHDFPGVRLVGVVLADIGLHLPDFRAAERTFQLLTQVAGRAGRDRAPGRVVVQTYAPDHYAVKPVRRHDYEAFYAEELSHRSALGYPPFGGLAHVIVSGADADAVLAAAQTLAQRAAPEPGTELLGPAPAPLARLRGQYRFQLLVKGADVGAVRGAADRLRQAAARLPDGIQAVVDPRPVHML
ncbi:MAG: primosomal protein N' [Myxococcota bacterium]|nr:primosomal protein N' [Myxococcota bacterium]